MKKINWLIIFILLVAVILRLYNLGEFPNYLTPDEASLGYNAYSILHTAKDEYGTFLPLVFKSFGDYKPGLYVYLTVPYTAIFGLNEWSVRLPSALLGVLSVWLIYQITQLVFPHKHFKIKNLQLEIGHFSALALSLSPWHIQFSRGAWEAQVSLTLTLMGIWLFLTSLTNSTKLVSLPFREVKQLISPERLLYLSSILFGLTLWTYQGAKISTLLVLIALVLVYAKLALKSFSKKTLFTSFILLIIITIPIALGLLTGTAGRLKTKNIFSYQPSLQEIQQSILEPAHISQTSVSYLLFHNQGLYYLRAILNRYFNYFSGKFLFAEGDWAHPQLTPIYMGVIYWLDLLALIFGILFLIRQTTRYKYFILIWLLLSPLPGAITLDQINSVRTLNMIIPLAFLIGFGWYYIFIKVVQQKLLIKICLLFLILFIMLFQMIYYLDSYYLLSPKITTQNAQGYGYKQAVQSLQPYRHANYKIIVQQSYDQPYIYFLLYEKFSPQKYHQVAYLQENQYGDVGLINQIDQQIEFRNFSFNAEKHLKGNIYIGDLIHLPSSATADAQSFKEIQNIYYPNGQIALRVIEIL